MICGTFVARTATEAEADIAVKSYKTNSPRPLSVTKERDNTNPNMPFKVTAVFQPCPEGTEVEHSATGDKPGAVDDDGEGDGDGGDAKPEAAAGAGPPPGTRETWKKPPIAKFIQSPNYSSRNGSRVGRIIVHYTTSDNVDGTIAHFLNPASQVSAHYIVARDGKIYQMVRDADKAWHALGANSDSIGIEHSAAPGEQMTADQEQSSVSLIKWLLSEYKLRATAIHGHRFTPENAGHTECPGELFGAATQTAVDSWVAKQFAGF